jgi:Zn-finger nucleic acid-binding protein
MKCPRCSSVLSPVEYAGVQIHLCPKCKGEWLNAGDLQKIVEHHDEVFTPEEIASLTPVDKEVFTAEEDDHDDLKCPSCQGGVMEHFNYADTSGIILHKCPACGGIWADKDELTKIEEVVDGWKADLNKDAATYDPVLQKIDAEEQAELDRSVSISRFGFVNAVLRHFCE